MIVDERHEITCASYRAGSHRSAKVGVNDFEAVLRSASSRREGEAGEFLSYAYFAVGEFEVIL